MVSDKAYPRRVSAAMKVRSDHKPANNTGHEELRPTVMKRNEAQVRQMIQHVKHTITDPFAVEDQPEIQLINISTGLCK